MTGVPGPRLLPLFLPVMESTELGRSLPRLVASATASAICFFITIWFAPTGVLISNVGKPVSWQIGPSSSWAMSMFWPMMASAWPDCVAGSSVSIATPIACRTSGGSLVEVWMISSSMLSRKNCMCPPSHQVSCSKCTAGWPKRARARRESPTIPAHLALVYLTGAANASALETPLSQTSSRLLTVTTHREGTRIRAAQRQRVGKPKGDVWGVQAGIDDARLSTPELVIQIASRARLQQS